VYSIPQFGGEPAFEKIYPKSDTNIEKIIEDISSWT
jgi:hypothetical protein